ncbi:N-acetylmuramoyl-L-alanine amidase [Flavobacterium sp. Sd200]|uniref:N-acetylmuramoyl-L-alanine amidase family protein n=1 Tax=Flavobacterium sp. Sd200 TaxID=2692211 RepID=UPI0013679D93|nr:N-acetylmuramoyl-L-alanine amidase [Flavobacterium sp. Sd200]MXN90635.1 N-acetylmuramoyl-L-alanine amidase [Flavobacterium sp. Sd200]
MRGNFSFKIVLFFFLFFAGAGFAQGKKFKVVIDAGHGGHDSGTKHNSYAEKKIVLNTALKLGKILENEPGFKVIYTRKTDVFVELRERANIANRADADLFISIHCNGVNNREPQGTETFVMGLTRSKVNMEVARKENSVITLEKDYKLKYKGFDPNSQETGIGITLAQEQYLKQSITLAAKIQDGFSKGLKRYSRGVKQTPLWVLDATAMPGVLIELGFVSNAKEGKYLNSAAGQQELANTIAKAVISYKKQYYTHTGDADKTAASVTKGTDAKVKKTVAKDVVFKIQIAASSNNIATKSSNFKGLKLISKEKNGKLIQYYYGKTAEYETAEKLLDKAKAKGYKSAFIVAFKGGKKITVKEALK